MKYIRVHTSFLNTPKQEKLILALPFVFLFLGYSYQLTKGQFILVLILSISFVFLAKHLLKQLRLKSHSLGFIVFENHGISIKKGTYLVETKNISSINLRQNCHKRKGKLRCLKNGFATIKITQHSGDKMIFNFICDKENLYENLKQIIRHWYLSGININETFGPDCNQTICLKFTGRMSFAEITKLKDELKIKT